MRVIYERVLLRVHRLSASYYGYGARMFTLLPHVNILRQQRLRDADANIR